MFQYYSSVSFLQASSFAGKLGKNVYKSKKNKHVTYKVKQHTQNRKMCTKEIILLQIKQKLQCNN